MKIINIGDSDIHLDHMLAASQETYLCGMVRLVQSFQLSFILIILLYYRYIHFLFSNTPMKDKTVTTCSFRI